MQISGNTGYKYLEILDALNTLALHLTLEPFISVYKTIGVDARRLLDNPTFGFSKVSHLLVPESFSVS